MVKENPLHSRDLLRPALSSVVAGRDWLSAREKHDLREDLLDALARLSVTDLLRALIADTDLIEVAGVLDLIAHESNREVQVWHGPQREYPLKRAKGVPPCP